MEASSEKAFYSLEIIPDKPMWRQWLLTILASMGSGLLLVGVVFFFAFNWEDMHRFSRFALLGSGVLITTLIAFRLGVEGLAGQLALTATAVFTGVLLATFGMVYQTGADSYKFFASWAVLILPWVLVSRFQVLWLIAAVVANLAVITWADIYLHVDTFNPNIDVIMLITINGLILLLREMTTLIHPNGQTGRWFPRLVGFALVAIVTTAMLEMITEHFYFSSTLGFYIAVLGSLALFYYMKRDLFIIFLVLGSLILVGTVKLVDTLHLSISDLVIFIFLVGTFIAATVAAAVHLLLKLSKQWANEEAAHVATQQVKQDALAESTKEDEGLTNNKVYRAPWYIDGFAALGAWISACLFVVFFCSNWCS